jgi:HAT1-interacting factor 1
MARVSYAKHLDQLNSTDADSSDKGKEVSSGDNAMLRHVKERLSDTHDLLAEIHLENEKSDPLSDGDRVTQTC